MSETHYEWESEKRPPNIQQHSIAKHEILRSYLIEYVKTLTLNPRQDTFRLTLVDGFSGGGIYLHATTGKEIFGSPFVMMEAMKDVELLINSTRQKKINLIIDYFFIEENKKTAEVLKNVMVACGYGEKLDVNIFIINGKFQESSEIVIDFIKNKGRAARSIFLLDQYGYSEVPTSLISSLFNRVQGAEIILTFAVDSFLTYAGDNKSTKTILEKIGVNNIFNGRTIKEIKQSEKNWRYFIQSCFYNHLVANCGAKFYTPFFIRSSNGHGDYWLLHFSQRARARDVMTKIHWDKNNYFIHYGRAGINMFEMLGYVPEEDSNYTGQSNFGFCFDSNAKDLSISKLSEQIPHLIYPDPDGMSFGELFATTCNTSPASSMIYREALEKLISLKEIEVVSPDGVGRRAASSIQDCDQILPPRQSYFLFK